MVTAEWDSAFDSYVYPPSIHTQSSDLFGRLTTHCDLQGWNAATECVVDH